MLAKFPLTVLCAISLFAALVAACGANEDRPSEVPSSANAARSAPDNTRTPPPSVPSTEAEVRARMRGPTAPPLPDEARPPEEAFEDLVTKAQANPPTNRGERQLFMSMAALLIRQMPADQRARAIERVGVILKDPHWIAE